MSDRAPRRGNLLDLFFVFLLLFCLLGAFFRRQSLQSLTPNDAREPLVAVLLLKASDPRMAESLTEGEAVYRASGEHFGTLIAVAVRPCRLSMIEDGAAVEGTWDPSLFCDLYLTVRFLGTKTGDRVLHGGSQPLSVGERITLYTERAELSGLIARIGSDGGKLAE